VDTRVTSYAVVYSLFGGYILPRGGEIWTGSLIRALASLNFSEGLVRTTISRMKQADYLESRRVGRRSFYRLTDLGLDEVQRAGNQAFETSSPEWDGQWTVITYSIPEEHRELRDTLRTLLKMHGFGSLVPGAWISPYSLPVDMEKKFQKIGAWGYLEIFKVKHLGPSNLSDFVANAWPHLTMLADYYQAYKRKYERVLEQFEKETLTNEACFTLRLRSLFEFVAITLEDPGLPSTLLPVDWPHPEALTLYKESRDMLAEPAERFFDDIYETNEAFKNHR